MNLLYTNREGGFGIQCAELHIDSYNLYIIYLFCDYLNYNIVLRQKKKNLQNI